MPARQIITAIVVLLPLGIIQSAVAETPAKHKKLIEWGWDEPDTKFMREHVAQMEQFPFDGLVFRAVDKRGVILEWEIWGSRKFELAEFQQAIDDLKATSFHRLADRFLRVNVTPGDVDWFDDAAWAVVLQNFTVAAEIVKQGGCKGLMFDTEEYHSRLFHYGSQKHRRQKSYDDYRAKVRQRGREWMKAINGPLSEVTILVPHSYAVAGSRNQREAMLYGLLADFLDGMLEVATPETRLVDAWESAYLYKTKVEFERAYGRIHNEMPTLAADAEKYRRHFEAGFGIWMDGQHEKTDWNTDDLSKNYFTPAAFEDSLRAALETSDQYVWIYTERPRWWTRQRLPQPYIDALTKAREPSHR